MRIDDYAKAMEFAKNAHESVNQKRKYTGLPYITHPVAVAHLVRQVPHTAEMVKAAYLHDTVEDTNTTFSDIENVFGKTVEIYVRGLTDVSKPEDGNRAKRKKLDRDHLAKQLPEIQTIKLADIIHNTSDIVKYGGKFAPVYVDECLQLLAVLTQGDKTLHKHATKLLEDAHVALQP